jgi:lanthionine-containing peptide SapB
MSILDLQGMAPQTDGGGGHGSSNSDHSCPSTASVTLCDGTSGLSLLLCH